MLKVHLFSFFTIKAPRERNIGNYGEN